MHYKTTLAMISLLLFVQTVCMETNEKFGNFVSLPDEIRGAIVSYCASSCKQVASLKQVCKSFNEGFSFKQMSSLAIEAGDENVVTRGLVHFAHTNQEEKFTHFFYNNKKHSKTTV